jgi:hypothetical protein
LIVLVDVNIVARALKHKEIIRVVQHILHLCFTHSYFFQDGTNFQVIHINKWKAIINFVLFFSNNRNLWSSVVTISNRSNISFLSSKTSKYSHSYIWRMWAIPHIKTVSKTVGVYCIYVLYEELEYTKGVNP